MEQILVTDSLFIDERNVAHLNDAGFEVERLDKPKASEDELITALRGKVGYILGGIEEVTARVIEASPSLRAIAFTGSDWRNFITGHERAVQQGVAIAACPGANAHAVAEYALTLMLAATRRIHALGRPGSLGFATTPSLSDCRVGLIGMGKVAQALVPMLRGLGVRDVVYFSRTRRPEVEKSLDIRFAERDEVLASSDVVSLHASKEAGNGYIGHEELRSMKDQALLVDVSFTGAVDRDALYEVVAAERIRAFLDHPLDGRFSNMHPDRVWHSNESTAFNTLAANERAGDMATSSLINLLTTGSDPYRMA